MAWKTAQFMEQHLGEEYEALIISVQKFGFFVELMEIFVEGMVPIDRIEEITGEHVFYRDQDHAIVSGSGHAGAQREGSRDASSHKNSRKKSGRGTPRSGYVRGNWATASACAPNASIRFAAALSFHRYPKPDLEFGRIGS